MAHVWHSFWGGWGRAARLWPVVLLLYATDTALALVMAIPGASQLAAVFGYSSAATELLGPVSLDWLIELPGSGSLAAFPWPLYVVVPVLFLLVTTFLRGGVLGALASVGDTSFGWNDFFSDCARHFWRLLLLLLFAVPGLAVLALTWLVANVLIGLVPGLGSLTATSLVVRGAVLFLLTVLLLTVLDYARISLVLDPGHSVARHAGRGLRFALLRFPGVLLLTLAFWVAAALIAAVYPGLVTVSTLFDGFWTALLIQQLAAGLASLQRTAMLGGQMLLFASAVRADMPDLE